MQNNKIITLNTSYKKGFKFRFFPDSEQKILLEQLFGSVRFVYNKILDYSIIHYSSRETKLTDDFGDLIIIKNNAFKSLSSTDRINYIQELKFYYPWLYNISSIALQQSIINLNKAYSNFFNKVKSNKIGKLGFPKFKKKCNTNSFKIVGKNSLHFDNNGSFTLPKFNKPLDIKFSRDFDRTKVSSVTVSKEPNGHYFISFLSEDNYIILPSTNHKIAFDSGIKNNITSFNGQLNNQNKGFNTYNLPDLKSILNRIKFIQKELSRKVKGSNNRNKARIKLAKLHAKKENIVTDFYHKLSFNIVNKNQVIIAEDLNLASMKENKSSNVENKSKQKNIRRSLQNISLSKIYQYIEYKALWYGKTFIRADRYYPSSKLCSTPHCEYIHHELQLKERTWECPECGIVHDRDNNAALNLFNYNEDNAQRMIKKVLSYHKHKNKNNSIIVDNNKPAKIKLNKQLAF